MRCYAFRPTRLALALVAAFPTLTIAAPGAASPYMTDPQHSHVEDATSKGISQVNMITCFMGSMRPDALVNEGNYVALVDQSKCDPEARASSGNSSSTNSGSNAADYMTAIVNSSRASNSAPMIVKTWVAEAEDGHTATIFVHTSATEAPTATNPYGAFRMDFCGKPDAGGPCMFKGFLQGGESGLSFYEADQGGMGSQTIALQLNAVGTTAGSGKLQMDTQGGQINYSFAYNANYFRRSDGGSDQCFSRDASDPDTGLSVWRYGLYDAATGSRITRNSGFPIEYTANGRAYHGYLGYWGLHLPPDAMNTLTSGATIAKVDYNGGEQPVKTNYTVVKADGKLMKYTKKTRTLRTMDKIRFTTWVGDVTGFFAGAQANTQYEMYWDDVAGDFKVTGQMSCGQNGCQTADLGAMETVAASYFGNLGGAQGWSQALGGEIFIPLPSGGGAIDSTAVNVIYRTQDLVYPSEMPATLYCLRECPTAATMSAYFAQGSVAASPFVASTFNNWAPTAVGSVVSYTTNANAALLKDGADQGVTFTDREALMQRPQYQWGVRTGRLFTNLAAAACDGDPSKYCDYKVNGLDTYYVWETGPNNWNQFAAVKDNNGAFVNFDAPLQVTYNAPNDAAKYGTYAGKSIVLQYGGFGDLWGIPGKCVSRITNEPVSCDTQDSRYVPSFVIPFNQVTGVVTSGATTYLVKWLDREIRFAKKNLAVCTTAGLNLPAGVTLPTAASLQDPSDANSGIYIGAKPVIADAPRVIHGDVKY